MRRMFLGVGLFSAFLGLAGFAQKPAMPAEPDFNAGVARSPAELRNGVAPLAQVQEFLGVNDDQLHGEPVWETEEADVDLDGVKDLLISNHLMDGVGGHSYAVFLKTSKGFRYVGDFQGFIRTLPLEKGKPVRFIISALTETDAMSVELAELQADGLHRLAKVRMTTNGCEAKDNAVYQELVCSDKGVSAETLKNAFPNLLR